MSEEEHSKIAEEIEKHNQEWVHRRIFKYVQTGNLKKVQYMVDNFDVNINGTDVDEAPLLYYAIGNKYPEIVTLLLKSGANPNISMSCAFGGNAIHTAAEGGTEEIFKILVIHGGDVNYVDWDNQTPLLMAVWNENYPIVKLLLRSDIDINHSNDYGSTALHLACRRSNSKIVKLLLQYGAAVNVASIEDGTPLSIVVRYDNIEIADLLLQHSAMLTTIDSRDCTELHLAAKLNRGAMIELIIGKYNFHADTYGPSTNNCTPLHYAVFYNHYEATALLLRYGADINLMKDSGQTVFSFAKDRNIIELLLTQSQFVVNECECHTIQWVPSNKRLL